MEWIWITDLKGAIIFTPDIESHYISTVQLVLGIFPSKMNMNHSFLRIFWALWFLWGVGGWSALKGFVGAEGKERSSNKLVVTSKKFLCSSNRIHVMFYCFMIYSCINVFVVFYCSIFDPCQVEISKEKILYLGVL